MRVDPVGKWKGVLSALGVESLYLTGKPCACPLCGGGKDRFIFDDKRGKGTWLCHTCMPRGGDGWELLKRVKRVEFREAADMVRGVIGDVKHAKPKLEMSDSQKRASMNELWKKGVPVQEDDPVWRYLLARRIEPLLIDRMGSCLRYVEALKYHDPKAPSWHPAMIAMVRDHGGNPCNIHRTYLTEEGTKAPVEAARRVMSGRLPHGCAIQLMTPLGPSLGVSEGIETALSAASLFGIPVWATINTSMMERWDPPKRVSKVVIFGDNDLTFAGQKSAYDLANRLALLQELEEVKVEIPVKPGTDWNDRR